MVLSNFNDSIIECDKQNDKLYEFNGNISIDAQTRPLSYNQLLLRGAKLKNTKWVYAVAVYTGHDTKIMMNSTSS